MGTQEIALAFQGVVLVVAVGGWLIPQPVASRVMIGLPVQILRRHTLPLAVILAGASLVVSGLMEYPWRGVSLAAGFAFVCVLAWQTHALRRAAQLTEKPQPIRRRRERNRVTEGGVVWEDEGDSFVITAGPYCPDDLTPLGYQPRRGYTKEHHPAQDNDWVSSYHGLLKCAECGKTFVFSDRADTVKDARNRAHARLKGARKRREAKPGRTDTG